MLATSLPRIAGLDRARQLVVGRARPRRARRARAAAASWRTPVCAGRIWISPPTRGRNSATTSRTADGKRFVAADDQQVVGAADAAHPHARAPARARPRRDHDAVAAAEAHDRHRLAAQRGVDELALGAVLPRERRVAGRVDQLGVDEVAAAEVHAAPAPRTPPTARARRRRSPSPRARWRRTPPRSARASPARRRRAPPPRRCWRTPRPRGSMSRSRHQSAR